VTSSTRNLTAEGGFILQAVNRQEVHPPKDAGFGRIGPTLATLDPAVGSLGGSGSAAAASRKGPDDILNDWETKAGANADRSAESASHPIGRNLSPRRPKKGADLQTQFEPSDVRVPLPPSSFSRKQTHSHHINYNYNTSK